MKWAQEKTQDLVIPDSVERIEEYAFLHTNIYGNIIFGSGLKYLGNGAFCDCFLAEIELNFNDGLEHIGDQCFYNNKFSKITLPNTLKHIGSFAFSSNSDNYNGKEPIELYIPSSVETIGDGVMISNAILVVDKDNKAYDSRNNSSMIFETKSNKVISASNYSTSDDSIESIGNHAFYKLKLMNKFILPDSVKQIGDYAFYRTNFLKNITFKNVERIGNHAFEQIYNIDKITISENVNFIGENAFVSSEFKEIIVSSLNEKYCALDSIALIEKNSYKLIAIAYNENIPRGVKIIGSYTLRCFEFENGLLLPDTIEKIEENAFSECYFGYKIIFDGTEEEFKLIKYIQSSEEINFYEYIENSYVIEYLK